MRHGDERAHDFKIPAVHGDVTDKGRINLEGVQGKALEQCQRRVADAEVIDGETDPHGAQPVQGIEGRLGILHDGALRDLEHQRARIQAGIGEGAANEGAQIPLPKLAGRDVDGHGDRCKALFAPALVLRTGFPQDPFPDSRDQPHVLGDGNETSGRDPAQLRTVPTQERLHSRDTPFGDAHLRLVVQRELSGIQCAPEVLVDEEPVRGPGVQLRSVELVVVAPQRLGVIAGGIRIAHQCRDVRAVPRIHGNAQAGAGEDFRVPYFECTGQGLDGALGISAKLLRPGDVFHDEGKLVAAQARHRVMRLHTAGEALGHALQQLVAPTVPEGVVDELEAVEIQEHDRRLAGAAPGFHDRIL